MRFDLADWDGAVQALKDSTAVAVACHVNPDGDAIGSVLAASLALRRLGKTTYPSWGTPGLSMPVAYRFLSGADSVLQPTDVPDVEMFLALDCAAADRLGELEPRMRAAERVINVDHHPGNDRFGDFNLVVEGASSTAELTTALIKDLGVDIDLDIATCLYTGLVTDTGRFQYANSSPETLRLAADLIALGVPVTTIGQEVFESSPFGYLKLTGRVLERAKLFEAERFVYSWITQEDLDETGVGLDETERLIDLIRSTRAADVAALYKEQPEGNWRVSLRSKGAVSVRRLAQSRGGGGHELAAGFTADDVEGSVRGLLEDLRASATA